MIWGQDPMAHPTYQITHQQNELQKKNPGTERREQARKSKCQTSAGERQEEHRGQAEDAGGRRLSDGQRE